ncbi:hypothetical protein BCR43DRAFT_487463 [Syncephalastrum racemosum]|uniref:Uncharacterized protein n=1 Tax=Syncephalastrum racemosum TaxID=13706 RepID=A0A1X2HQU9_SYNRA|nr:hypothetical protein BCR43DRAFT_487463 [Syncephalastrum racemosum]
MESQGNEKAVDLQEALIHEANYLLTYSNIVKGWTRQMTLTSDCSSSSSQETDSSQKPVCIKVIHTGVMKGEEEGLRAMQIMVDYHVQRAKLAGELDRLPASGEGRLAYKKAIRCMEQVQEFQTMYLLRKVEDTYLLFWDAAKELFDSTN